MSDDGYTRITLRIPMSLHQRLTQAAADRSHSMNAEIITRLESSFGEIGERLSKLEALVFGDELGNEALLRQIMSVEEDYQSLLRDLARQFR
ncbi:Arc family DNA-binding protein [Pararoseomonas indoligenes]|uniref:Arc family DNA-binding protein n=1 Tax=Roseomonas indoligenes TaxID=2820811 RepID=A0A940S6L1_9PROT|nr:Arc family DNA-binding protein [Pararoseomonas indoligenes]MBP0492162.1 Arc family DNA-binding protein [Pararoseomonas indoligenes]